VGVLEVSFERYENQNTSPMNRRYIIIASIVLAILLAIVRNGCSRLPEQIVHPTYSEGSTRPSRSINPKSNKEPETKEEYAALVKEKCIAFAKANNAPIAFYGRVVDQDSKPLQGVAVEYYVTAIPLIPVLWGPDETTNGSCITDQNGLFSVEGKRGVSLGVSSLIKAGYRESGYYEQGHARYEPYGSQRHIPNRDKAVEFMLIRDDLPKAEEVFDKQLELIWNSSAITENIRPGVGKLEFTASRTGRDANDTMKKFEWEVKMRAEGFTMTKLPNENERMAPLVGYASNGRVGFSPDNKTWKLRTEESYAIRTDSGSYGIMNLSVYGDGDDGGVSGSVTVYLNKSGARNIDHK
jgi:hypothetical protein